jgi:predicted PurR-regulated permease PerM
MTQRESNRALVALAGVAIVALLAAGLHWARVVLIPVALAIYFSFTLTPLVVALQRRGLGRVLTVSVVVGASLIASGGDALVVGHQIVQLTETLPDHAERIKDKVATIKKWVTAQDGNRFVGLVNDVVRIFEPPPDPTAGAEDPNAPTTVVVDASPSWVTRAQAYLTPAVEILGQAAFTLILVVFMLLRREDLRNRVIRLLGQGRITTTTKAVDDASRRISRYLLAQFLLNTAFGLAIALGLFLLGVPYATLWGFTAFLMRYVPYVGTWIGLIPPTILTFAITEGWFDTVAVLVLFLGLEIVCNNFIEPLLYGARLGLSEVAQLIATVVWAFLWGPVGMILAWPLTTCLLMIGKYVPQFGFLNVLLGDEPVLSPRMAFYQRLAARDQDESVDILEKELTARPVVEVFDDLILPALVAARREAREGRLSDADVGHMMNSVREIAEAEAEFKLDAEPPAADAPKVRALLIGCNDVVDQTAVELLARLLDPGLWETEVVPAAMLASELLARAGETRPAVVVIGTLPPGGLTHTRYLCKRLRQCFAQIKIVVGHWNPIQEQDDKVIRQLRDSGADEVVYTLQATLAILSGWRSVFAAVPTVTKKRAQPKATAGRTIGTHPA